MGSRKDHVWFPFHLGLPSPMEISVEKRTLTPRWAGSAPARDLRITDNRAELLRVLLPSLWGGGRPPVAAGGYAARNTARSNAA